MRACASDRDCTGDECGKHRVQAALQLEDERAHVLLQRGGAAETTLEAHVAEVREPLTWALGDEAALWLPVVLVEPQERLISG